MGGWIPGWAWILMLGTVAVFGLSVAGHYYLSPKMGNRAWWALGELSVGVVLMVVGTVWGFVKSLPQREEYTVFQLIDPTRLIEYTIRSLPDTRRPVWLGAWGLTAVLCSVFIIGGLSHFLARPRPRANPTLDLADTARERLQQQMEDFADSDDLPSERPATASADPDRDTATDLDEEDDGGKPRRFSLHCVVVGYVPDKDGNISRLVLATEHDGKYQFAGLAVPSADSPSTAQKLQQLKELVTTDRPPIVVEKIKPVWVKPELACEVRYGERGPDGTLQRSQIKNWTK